MQCTTHQMVHHDCIAGYAIVHEHLIRHAISDDALEAF
jgi:hypothetical protein